MGDTAPEVIDASLGTLGIERLDEDPSVLAHGDLGYGPNDQDHPRVRDIQAGGGESTSDPNEVETRRSLRDRLEGALRGTEPHRIVGRALEQRSLRRHGDVGSVGGLAGRSQEGVHTSAAMPPTIASTNPTNNPPAATIRLTIARRIRRPPQIA